MNRYAKFLAALIPVLVIGLNNLSDALGDGAVSSEEWVALSVAVLSAVLVYAVPNRPPAGQPADPGISEQHAPS